MLNNLCRRTKDGDKITNKLDHKTENRPASSSSASAPSSITGISPVKQCRSRWRSLKKVAMKSSSNRRKQWIASNSSRTTRASASAATYTLRTCLTTIATSATISPRTQRTTSVIAIATLAHAFTQDFVYQALAAIALRKSSPPSPKSVASSMTMARST